MPLLPAPNTPDWCRAIPKVELHAHLTGCVRSETVKQLLDQPQNDHLRARGMALIHFTAERTLKECFELFPLIHQLITNAEVLRKVTLQALDDFERENTVYLELRTTPRRCEELSPEDYVLTVLQAISDYHEMHPGGMVCRLLVSISRHLPVSDAIQTVQLTEKLLKSGSEDLKELIVGMEFSGDPTRGDWNDFEPILREARVSLKLPVSLHFGEVENEKECMQMLDFEPDRIGHAAIISERVKERLITQKRSIGVEVCLTSNLAVEQVEKIAKHPVVTTLVPANHPFCLCTDDPGILDTTLSHEYGRLVDCMGLSRRAVEQIALQGMNMVFCRDSKAMNRVSHNARRMLSGKP